MSLTRSKLGNDNSQLVQFFAGFLLFGIRQVDEVLFEQRSRQNNARLSLYFFCHIAMIPVGDNSCKDS
jgi:hypothetical protein